MYKQHEDSSDNDLNPDQQMDRQADMVRDKGTVVFKGYCRASPLVPCLILQPAH